ncbi:MAG TPA: hypothetical protein VFZ71_06215 [Pyrinomonadaceae bacterium]
MGSRKENTIVSILRVCSSLLLICTVSTHAQVVRKKNAPVETKQPTSQGSTTPGTTEGIIIVGGKGNKDVIAKPAVPAGPLETREEALPRITPHTNPVSLPVYIPNGQTAKTVDVSFNARPAYWYCEIFLSVNGGEESEFARGEQGTKSLTVNLNQKYDLTMVVYSDDVGSNPTKVAKLTLLGQPKPEAPPAGGGGGNANSGMFESKRPGTVLDNAIQFFRNLQVKPQPNSAVTFSFETSTPSEFFVEISKQRPNPNVPSRVHAGQPLGAAFPPNTQLAAFTLPGLSGVKSKHEVTLRGAGGHVLEANTTYHYMITAKGPDGSYWRHGGKFSMGGRDVRIVWEKIKIINDSDDASCGEIDLWFWANYGQDGGKYLGIGRFNDDTACTDSVYQINREMTLEDAPHILSLSVSGRDDDDNTGIFDGRLGAKVQPPLEKARDGGTGESNVAAKDFDLTGFEVGASIPFKLISLPAFAEHEEGDLMFEVWGRIEILAPR